MRTPCNSFILSKMDYCNAILTGLPASILAPLQRVMHAAARVIYDLKPYDHITPTLKALHWLPVKQRIEFKLCLLVHLVINKRTPVYLQNLLTTTSSAPGRASNTRPATTSQRDSNSSPDPVSAIGCPLISKPSRTFVIFRRKY